MKYALVWTAACAVMVFSAPLLRAQTSLYDMETPSGAGSADGFAPNGSGISAATTVPKIKLRMRPAPIIAAYSEVRGSRRRLQCRKVRAAQQTGNRTQRTDILGPAVVFAGRRSIKFGAR